MKYAFLASALAITMAAPVLAQRPQLTDNVRRYVSIDTSAVAITNVTILDGRGGPARAGQVVVIRDGLIADIGPSVRPPAGAKVIDGSGMTLIPGMVGMHDHLFYTAAGGFANQMNFTAPRLYLASGVTTIRTTGGRSPYADLNLRKVVDRGEVPGPRIHVTTPYLTGGESGGSMFATNEPQAASRFVNYWASEGATWVKFYADIDRATMKAAIDEAHRVGIKTTGHLCSVTFREAMELGIDDFAHGSVTASDFTRGKQADKCPTDMSGQLDSLISAESSVGKELIRDMVKKGVSMTTTMPVYELFYPNRPVTDQRTLELMAPPVREAYLRNRAYIDSAKAWPLSAGGFTRALAFDKAFYDAGGVLASGVDPTGNGGALPGFGDQRGYELLVEAGFRPEQAVQVVSFNGARILGVSDRLGSVEKGKVADVVLLRGDLAKDASVIRNVEVVFKDGVGYDPAKLIAAVKGRVGID